MFESSALICGKVSSAMASLFLFALSIIFFQLPSSISSSAPGTLAFFLDEQCEQASYINPTTNLPTDVCLVTPGALGIAVKTLPPCASGDASLIMYTDTSCARESSFPWAEENCWFNGPDGVSAVMFVCKDTSGGSSATATSTVSAGSSSMPVAAGAAATPVSGGTAGQNASPSSNTDTTPTSASSASPKDSSPGSSPSSGVSSGNSAGLKHNGQIILGVVLPVAGVAIALLAWLFPCKKSKKRRGVGDAEQDRYQMIQTPSQHSIPVQSSTPPAAGWPPYGNVPYQQYPHPSFGNGRTLSGTTVAGQGYGQAV